MAPNTAPQIEGRWVCIATDKQVALAARQALVRLCQQLNFGVIQNISVLNTDPVFEEHSVVLVDEKLDAVDAPRAEAELADFELATELRRLMIRLDEIQDGKIERIEVRAGIPRRVVFESSIFKLFSLEKTNQPR